MKLPKERENKQIQRIVVPRYGCLTLKKVKLQGQGHKVKNFDIHGKVLSQGIHM